MSRKKLLAAVAVLAVVPLAVAGCSSRGGGNETNADGKTVISLWTHSAGNESEMVVLSQILEDFNASQEEYEVVKQDFPQEAYNDSVQGAAASNDLPCILDVDGPIMPNWAWNGWMVPTGLTDADVENFLPSAVGRYDGEIYSVGFFDVTTVMFTLQSVLDKHGARVPTVDEPWTAQEYADLQDKIKASGDFDYVVDYGPGWTGEWWSYAYSPLLQSFGGDLIDRETYESADGVLNGPDALAFATWFQGQFKDGYAPTSNAQDRTEFRNGNAAIQYNGTWGYQENFEQFGDDLLIIPTPDFGHGSIAGAGSWQYGITKSCSEKQKTGALEWLKFAMNDEYIAAFSDGNSLIPATTTAAALTTNGLYGEGDPLEIAVEILEKNALVRPATPAYLVISQVFEKNLQDITNGADPQTALDQMVKEIDADIASAGYNK